MALALAAWFAVGQANLLLRQFQQADTQAYGISALGGGLRISPETAQEAVRLWKGFMGATSEEARTFVVSYTVLDVVLIALLAWLAASAMARLTRARQRRGPVPEDGVYYWYAEPWIASSGPFWRRCRPLLAFVIADLLEDGFRVLSYATEGEPGFVTAAWAAEKLKWVAVLTVLLTLGAGLWDVHRRGSSTLSARQRRRRGYVSTVRLRPRSFAAYVRMRRAAKVLRGQVGLVVVFCLLLLLDATGQVGDIVRRWIDAPLSLVAGIAATALMSLLLWSSCRRIILSTVADDNGEPDPGRSSRVLLWSTLVVTALALVLWRLFDSLIPFALPIVGLALLGLEALRLATATASRPTGWQVFSDRDTRAIRSTIASRQAPNPAWRRALQQLARVVATTPMVITGVVMVKAGTGPLVLAAASPGYGVWSGLALVLLGIALVVAGCLGIPVVLRAWDAESPGRTVEIRHLVLVGVALTAAAALVAWPLDLPPTIGSLAVVGVAFSVVGALLAELQRMSEVSVPPRGLAMVGFHRVPVLTLLGAWLVVASLLDVDGDYYDIRTNGVAPEAVGLNDVWDEWLDHNCVAAATGPVPLVLVTAHGGGIRAAYWTASVLTSLQQDSGPVAGCPTASVTSRMFTLTGISGGSVGAAAFFSQPTDVAEDWFEDDLGKPDYAAVALAGGLLVDLPRALIGFDAPDRAARLEQAWEQHIDGFDEDYFTFLRPGSHDERWIPVTLFNGAQVETGCRVNTSALRLTASSLSDTGDCRADVGRQATLNLEDRSVARRGTRVPAASVTVDTVAVQSENGCKGSFAVSTAALLSARWPYISPSGKLPCADPPVRVVDGGYADGAGNAALLDLWRQLEPLVAAHNGSVQGVAGLVVPVFVVIDNHYQSRAAAPPARRTAELLVPPVTYRKASGTRSADREQEAMSAIAASLPGKPTWSCQVPASKRGRVLLAPSTRPGLPAPLAWTLAGSSRADLDSQRDDLFSGQGAGLVLRQMLTGSGDPLTCQLPR
jgi:hypothetical protein